MRGVEAVALALCEDVAARLRGCTASDLDERACRKELIGCILASQVTSRSAELWTAAFEHAGLLEDRWWRPRGGTGFAALVGRVLTGMHHASRDLGRYRFFRTKASQIVAAREVVSARTLKAYLSEGDALAIRRRLVREIPGLGPKQASMLIRNLGISFDLAVLDGHVVAFMHETQLPAVSTGRKARLAGYEELEAVFRMYAERNGVTLGCLDWAIWLTMKASRELHL